MASAPLPSSPPAVSTRGRRASSKYPARGRGVAATRSQREKDCPPRYWQSDGGQPHLINIQFHKKMSISEMAFYLDYGLDESYTPKKMSVRAGTTFHDLVEIRVVDLHEPAGWVRVPLPPKTDTEVLRAFFLQVCVVSMHQNGRDTHVRQARIYGPRTPIDVPAGKFGVPFKSNILSRFAVLR